MKSRNKYLFLLIALVMSVVLLNCSKNDSSKPFVSYVRLTNPASADSLMTAANQGQMLVIMGGNLGATQQVWFNDQQATVNPVFVTNSNIIVTVPSSLPTVITNKLKLVFANGEVLYYDFTIDINKPRADSARSEYANVGDTVLIYGKFFYGDTATVKATFTGGVQGKTLAVGVGATRDSIFVKMPAGVKPGPVTITNNFGFGTSKFWMQDNRNIILGFGNMSGTNGRGASGGALWHPVGSDPDYATNSATGIAPINGNYLYYPFGSGGYLGGWAWDEVWTGNQPAPELDSMQYIPSGAFSNPAGYSLKFEVYTQGSLVNSAIAIWIGNSISNANARNPGAATVITWKPTFTNTKWRTVTIPWGKAYANLNANTGGFVYNASGYDISVVFQSGSAVAVQAFAIDNVRVVPNN